jgi:site-specific recombinase XerD
MTIYEKYEMYCKSFDITPPLNWERHLVRFYKWETSNTHINYRTNWEEFVKMLQAYILHMNVIKLDLDIKREALVVFESFFNFLYLKKELTFEPIRWIKPYYNIKRLNLNIITEPEFIELVNQATYVFDWHPIKVNAVFRTLFFGGLTRLEFNHLRRYHFKETENGLMLIVRKNMRVVKRTIILDDLTADYIRKYFAMEEQDLGERNCFNLHGKHTYAIMRKLNDVCVNRKLDYVCVTESIHYIKQFTNEEI